MLFNDQLDQSKATCSFKDSRSSRWTCLQLTADLKCLIEIHSFLGSLLVRLFSVYLAFVDSRQKLVRCCSYLLVCSDQDLIEECKSQNGVSIFLPKLWLKGIFFPQTRNLILQLIFLQMNMRINVFCLHLLYTELAGICLNLRSSHRF